ncbi:MAG: MMPL family transporter [Flavobacteriales bacterium]|nr:MMPL family transporter [Flavobacteriales bacterium]
MWSWLAGRVLRNRIGILTVVGVLTAFMGYEATKVQMNYKHGGLLPKSDPAYGEYEHFLKTFSADGNVIVVATQGKELYTPANFKQWYELGNDLKEIPGIDSVFSEANLFTLVRNDSLQKFDVRKLMTALPTTQVQMDSLKRRIDDLPFYKGLLYNDSTKASLMMLFVNAKLFDTNDREQVIDALEKRVNEFSAATDLPVHESGLPWVRVKNTKLIKGDMPRYMLLSLAICALLLLLFFKSLRVMFICLGVVLMSVVWAFGCMALFGFGVTVLQSVIAPLVIVVGVPNCVFLVNAYHHEYAHHGNKAKSLQRMISRVGAASFMTNATTAAGFATFCVTYSDVLKQFGSHRHHRHHGAVDLRSAAGAHHLQLHACAQGAPPQPLGTPLAGPRCREDRDALQRTSHGDLHRHVLRHGRGLFRYDEIEGRKPYRGRPSSGQSGDHGPALFRAELPRRDAIGDPGGHREKGWRIEKRHAEAYRQAHGYAGHLSGVQPSDQHRGCREVHAAGFLRRRSVALWPAQ